MLCVAMLNQTSSFLFSNLIFHNEPMLCVAMLNQTSSFLFSSDFCFLAKKKWRPPSQKGRRKEQNREGWYGHFKHAKLRLTFKMGKVFCWSIFQETLRYKHGTTCKYCTSTTNH